MTKSELRIKLSEHIAKHGIVYLVGGALGELKGCNAYQEETRKDPMWQTKYYGISYWFKGITDNDIIDRVTIVKRAFVEIFKLLLPILPLILIFQRKKLIGSLIRIYSTEKGLKSKCLKQEEFCPVCQELIRVSEKFIKGEQLKDLVYCLAMFLQFSPSFRVRGQDVGGELDKDRLKKSFLREILRLRKIAKGREIEAKGVMAFLWGLAILSAILFRKTAYGFLMELDIEKVKLDEADWYLCLRRKSYRFGGKSLKGRLVEAETIDMEKDHLILGI